jgi:hypothetical protein
VTSTDWSGRVVVVVGTVVGATVVVVVVEEVELSTVSPPLHAVAKSEMATNTTPS